MGQRGDGYGSEDHLRRYLAEHPEKLNKAVAHAAGVPVRNLVWLDYPKTKKGDREFRGLEFLPKSSEVRKDWMDAWPTTGTPPTWDAVGHAGPMWLLVEAKANAPEFVTPPCRATSVDSRARIVAALNRTKRSLGVHGHYPWDGTYYQYANRLTVLRFLREHELDARLVFIYFTGDRFPDGTPCPQTATDWEHLIEARRLTLGLPKHHVLIDTEHHIFLPALKT